MRIIRRILLGVLGLVVVAVAYLFVAPPELLRVANGYAAKIVCSNVFLAGRDAGEVLTQDVQAPGNPILKLVRIDVDRDQGVVTAKLLGAFATGVAIYREGLGCAAVPDGNVAAAKAVQLTAAPQIAALSDELWPDGGSVNPTPSAELAAALADPKLAGPGMRAIVVVKDGRIVAERYGDGFNAETRLLGWSMTKTVNAALLAILVSRNKTTLEETGLFTEWAGDDRRNIAIANLLSMTSGLSFNEEYGDVDDVTRMLYLEPDMAKFAAGHPAVAEPGAVFNYSTGTGVMLARIWMNALPDAQAALRFPREALFGPLGMRSAVLEADESGTFVGGSYLYATGRDWARFGQFLLDAEEPGNKRRILQPGPIRMMAASNGLPGGYSQNQSWVLGPHESEPGEQPVGLPAGTFWMEGHDGQSVAIIPSQKLVVVRLGLTPWAQNYWPELLVKAVVAATAAAP